MLIYGLYAFKGTKQRFKNVFPVLGVYILPLLKGRFKALKKAHLRAFYSGSLYNSINIHIGKRSITNSAIIIFFIRPASSYNIEVFAGGCFYILSRVQAFN